MTDIPVVVDDQDGGAELGDDSRALVGKAGTTDDLDGVGFSRFKAATRSAYCRVKSS